MPRPLGRRKTSFYKGRLGHKRSVKKYGGSTAHKAPGRAHKKSVTPKYTASHTRLCVYRSSVGAPALEGVGKKGATWTHP